MNLHTKLWSGRKVVDGKHHMPLYHPKNTEYGFEIKTSPVWRKINPFNSAFVAGERVVFNLSIKPVGGKIEKLRIWRKLPGDVKYKQAPNIDITKHPNGLSISYVGELLTKKGDMEYVLAWDYEPVDPNDINIHLLSAVVLHPDEENNQLLLIFIAFLLASMCSLLEVFISFLSWRFPN